MHDLEDSKILRLIPKDAYDGSGATKHYKDIGIRNVENDPQAEYENRLGDIGRCRV